MAENDAIKWYVVHTYSGYENKVKANLEKSVENRRNGPFAPACGPGGFNIQCPLSFPKIIL